MKCPTWRAWTLGNRAKCVTSVWPIQTSFVTMITPVSFTSIQLNALTSSCNSLHSGHMFYDPAKEFNDNEECIDSEVKSSHWWWNEQVNYMNFVTAMIVLNAWIAMGAPWSYDCPFIWQFRPDTFYKLFRWPEGIANIFESQELGLDD